ncbi:uncharacterized protein N7458_006410 [Penicillium daleae]|uniref:Uncharacterized protein n=1 Tax=Penicillium daleae TaxID=63821 RepID=A0AAD6C625_9EURO|nr:uncharacterized protein N7458_006410 [Penicillium daleae]KAJ5449961.1 hypothetical protein N7458_006410 [Penicillium daleae]
MHLKTDHDDLITAIRAFLPAKNLLIIIKSLVLDLYYNARPELAKRYVDTQDLTALRKTFIYAATDEKLALGYLRIVPFRNRGFPRGEIYALDYFSRSILVTRYNFKEPGSLNVERVGKRAREIRRNQFGSVRLPERLRLLLHDIWPQVSERSNWWSWWTSYPLEAEST